jgi:hypothetical protein
MHPSRKPTVLLLATLIVALASAPFVGATGDRDDAPFGSRSVTNHPDCRGHGT